MTFFLSVSLVDKIATLIKRKQKEKMAIRKGRRVGGGEQRRRKRRRKRNNNDVDVDDDDYS